MEEELKSRYLTELREKTEGIDTSEGVRRFIETELRPSALNAYDTGDIVKLLAYAEFLARPPANIPAFQKPLPKIKTQYLLDTVREYVRILGGKKTFIS